MANWAVTIAPDTQIPSADGLYSEESRLHPSPPSAPPGKYNGITDFFQRDGEW